MWAQRYEVYSLINQLAEQGAAVIMISSEMSEVIGMSDRIIVMCEGRITGEIGGRDATQSRILALASDVEVDTVGGNGKMKSADGCLKSKIMNENTSQLISCVIALLRADDPFLNSIAILFVT